MIEALDYFRDNILQHAPFILATAFFYVMGAIMKAGPLSRERAETNATVRFIRRWLPLPLHPILGSILVGSIPGIPVSEGVAPGLPTQLYFLGAAITSIIGYDIYREFQKYRGKAVSEGSGGRGITLSDVDR